MLGMTRLQKKERQNCWTKVIEKIGFRDVSSIWDPVPFIKTNNRETWKKELGNTGDPQTLAL